MKCLTMSGSPRPYRAASSSLRGNSYTRQKGGKQGESEGGINCFWHILRTSFHKLVKPTQAKRAVE